jgi:integrase
MASLQARHTRACATGKAWTTFAPSDGCTCRPTFYVTVREGAKLHRERVGKNRQTAERALRKVGTAVDDGEYVPQKKISFDVWAEQWLKGLERKPNTVRGYHSTITYARAAFGGKQVRAVGVEDIKALLAKLRDDGLSDSTRAKHLRVLGACFGSAIESDFAVKNPVRAIKRGERPRAAKTESAYFTADELPRLFAHVEDGGADRVLFETALKTGLRLGELLALTWNDVDLTDALIHVRRTFTDGYLNDEPKNHERRDVDLTEDVVELLGAWWGELGSPGDEKLVFPGPTRNGYLNPKAVLGALYAAMEAAGVPRIGPTGEKRTFHSFRHTHAKAALESGRPITYLSRRLGHSSIVVTVDRYGHFERAASKRETAEMAGAFGV